MPKLVAFLFAAALGSMAFAAEGPRKVWTAAEVMAVSGGAPPAAAVAAEAAVEPGAPVVEAAPAKAKAKVRKAAATKAKKKKVAARTKNKRGATKPRR